MNEKQEELIEMIIHRLSKISMIISDIQFDLEGILIEIKKDKS